ncbi:MAG TPA: 4Fe-4S binding protein [Terriglobales bacterium]|jgi:polyferredoxin|nr:4Fe-4S binding protein [Terriglobales bacterium]
MATQLHTEIIPELPPLLPPTPRPEIPKPIPGKPKKKLVRRAERDYSQAIRRSFQGGFLLLNLYLGWTFYHWVRHFETGGAAPAVARPAGVEGYLPIAGMMNFKYWLLTGHVPAMHPAAMFLLITFAAMAFLFRKAFCSWLCPVGTISEYLWRAGQKIFRRNFHLPRWLDIPLRGLKYLLLGFFVWAVSTMSAGAIEGFMRSPYGVIADVKMLNFFRFIGETGLIVIGVLMLASVLVQNFWCRYLCPYGALLGLTSLFSPLRIRRDSSACIDCAKCAKACPSALPVDKLVTIKSAECTGCLECVAVCPAQGALQMSLPRVLTPVIPSGRVRFGHESQPEVEGPCVPRPLAPTMPAWAMAVGIAALFFGIVGFAKTAGYWQTSVPTAVYRQLVPHAAEATHPLPGDPGLN